MWVRRGSGKAAGQGSRGQSIVELSLVLPIVMMLLMGMIDLGFVLYAHVQVAAASYEGARAGTLYPVDATALLNQNDAARQAAVRDAVASAMGRLDLSTTRNFDKTTDVTFAYDPPTPPPPYYWSNRSGDAMVVTVRYRQPVRFTLLPGLTDGRFRVSTSTRVRIP